MGEIFSLLPDWLFYEDYTETKGLYRRNRTNSPIPQRKKINPYNLPMEGHNNYPYAIDI